MKPIKNYKIKFAMLNSCKVSLKFWILGFFLMLFTCAKAQFIITVKTDNLGASLNNQFTIPTNNTSPHTYNYNVNWGDSSTDDLGVTGDIMHTYSVVGTYTITITGDFPHIYFNNSGDKDKILSIEQWGNNPWASFENAFYGCSNLVINAMDIPNLTNVIDLNSMFTSASNLGNGKGNWEWNISNVQYVDHMFNSATSFNKNIGSWNTSSVLSMESMFNGATSFNQDIGNWNTSTVFVIEYMFKDATSFDQNLGNWDVSNVFDAAKMFDGVALSTSNYDSLLIGWNAQTLQRGVTFDGGNSKYCNAILERTNMVNNDSWDIYDGGLNCSKRYMRHGKSVENGIKRPMKF